jgi:hypothetical protein
MGQHPGRECATDTGLDHTGPDCRHDDWSETLPPLIPTAFFHRIGNAELRHPGGGLRRLISYDTEAPAGTRTASGPFTASMISEAGWPQPISFAIAAMYLDMCPKYFR